RTSTRRSARRFAPLRAETTPSAAQIVAVATTALLRTSARLFLSMAALSFRTHPAVFGDIHEQQSQTRPAPRSAEGRNAAPRRRTFALLYGFRAHRSTYLARLGPRSRAVDQDQLDAVIAGCRNTSGGATASASEAARGDERQLTDATTPSKPRPR